MSSHTPSVVTVGGASAERVLTVAPTAHRPGGKHTLPPEKIIAGGSAVNHACRLLSAGVGTVPVVPMCRDSGGEIVQATLLDAASRGGLGDELLQELFVEGDYSTPFTTILNVGEERTIYTEFSDELFLPFEEHVRGRVSDLDLAAVGAVMIGHLHCDRERAPGLAGRVTEHVVEACRAQGTPIFANFGSSQFRAGADRWASVLPELACFQLDIQEVRAFLSGPVGSWPSLREVLDYFAERCTVVVTMERMGAVGRLKGSENVVHTWPYAIEPTDTTGAGDAFGAGLVSAMLQRPIEDDESLRAAMDRGGLFAAYACTTRGGADRCPTRATLEAFHAENARVLATEVAPVNTSGKMLRLLDLAFPGDQRG